MISHRAKVAFFAVCQPAMRLNGCLYRLFRAPDASGLRKVQLGPGRGNYLQGWINVDANMFTGKCDVWADLRHPLPFRSATIDAFYSHHVVEHLPTLEQHFREVFRCLKPGGVYRVGGPNGDSAIAKFVANDSAWFIDFPDKRESIGGRFENFIFCRQEHVTILTRSYLTELMEKAGFVGVRVCSPVRETGFPSLFTECLAKEWESDFAAPHTLIMEAVKPPPEG